jgi:hypothetical protein
MAEDISLKEMEEADDLDNNSSGSETGSGSGSNFDSQDVSNDEELAPSTLSVLTVTQGHSKRIRKPINLAYINRFWDAG